METRASEQVSRRIEKMTSSPTRDGGEIDVVGALPHTLRANGDVSEELKVLADTLDDDVRSPLDNNDLESNGSSCSQRSSPGRRRAWNRDDDEPMLQGKDKPILIISLVQPQGS